MSHAIVYKYIEELVGRYRDSDTIFFWELGNEWNLIVDLDLNGSDVSICKECGTPSYRTKADNMSTEQMVEFQRNLVIWIKTLDSAHMVESGHGLPRICAEHLRASYYLPNRDWRSDTVNQFVKNLEDINADPLDFISVHIYALGGDNVRYNLTTDPNSAVLLEVGKDAGDRISKPFYVGEYGDLKEPRTFTKNVFKTLIDKKIGLSTLWIWEFYQSGPNNPPADFSIIPGRDDDIITVMQNTNAILNTSLVVL